MVAKEKIKMNKLRSYGIGYLAMFDILREKAQTIGYCLAVHGSLIRDFDIIAVPWVEDCADAEELVELICETTGGFIAVGDTFKNKPHGRIAWAIQLGGGPYIDLSVMPKVKE